jgi:DNA-directed RNA polymerase I, II, and III subunit RPABC2
MSELESEQLSEISNNDLEEQIDETEDEISLKPKDDDSGSDDDNLDDEDENFDDQNDEDNNDDNNDDDNNDDIDDETEAGELENETSIFDFQAPQKSEISSEINNDYDSDSESDYDENEFKKLNNEVKQNYLLKYHQETQIHNFDEILSLSKTVRNKKNVIIDELHKTIPILTKYEKTRILGERTKQINNGSKPFVEVENDIIDGYLIACKELEEKKMPFIIRRPLPSGGSEYWHIRDLEVI